MLPSPLPCDHLDTEKAGIEPVRSTQPRGAHLLYFDNGRGWLRYVFTPRTADPQIVIETSSGSKHTAPTAAQSPADRVKPVGGARSHERERLRLLLSRRSRMPKPPWP
ncbi:hypothetical protein ABT144_14415 [Streptomyces sp. NPDC002039]|uniref:hypothetical protein n=1 Tax=Streptomyces sp. NPDC002039 TaxID=3154660 RepID=UPI003333A79B